MEHIKSAWMFLELGVLYLLAMVACFLLDLPDPRGVREGLGRILLSLLFLVVTILTASAMIGGGL